MSERPEQGRQTSEEWVHRSELASALGGLTARLGSMSAAFAMTVTLALPWIRVPDSDAADDDWLLFELTRTFETSWETQQATMLRVAALLAVVTTVLCLVGAWRRWNPGTVVLAPALASFVLLFVLVYVDLLSAYLSAGLGAYAALVIQLGLFALWRSTPRSAP